MVPVLANDHRCGRRRVVLLEREPGTKYEITAPVLAPRGPRSACVTVCPQHRRGQASQEVFSCCFQKHIYFVFTVLGILSITHLGSSAV